MIRSVVTFAIVILFVSCSEEQEEKSEINHSYDIILGFAVPDEDRLAPTEVFVGRIRPKHPGISWEVQGANDEFLREQLFKYVDVYRAVVEWYEDAEVIISTADQTVQLEYTGFGIYRDVNDELQIEELKEYSLEVRRPNGLIYTDIVKVPGDIFITNFSPGDTLSIQPRQEHPSSTICTKRLSLKFNEPQHAGILQVTRSNNLFRPLGQISIKSLFFDLSESGVIVILGEDNKTQEFMDFTHEQLVLDPTATEVFNPFGEFAGGAEVGEHLDFWRDPENIDLRSGITINEDRRVIGNFGAYNAHRTHFTVEIKRDSCVLFN